MKVATAPQTLEVGVRDLKNGLSRYLDRVKDGVQIVVTEHGKPIARVTAIDAATDRLSELVAAGLVRPPLTDKRRLPTRRVIASGSVSDLVADQRR